VPVSSPISPALDQLNDLALWEAELSAELIVVESALVSRLSQVPDRRKRRGRRHPLVVVLVLAACATLVVGNDSIAAIWQWSAGASREKLERIGARRDALRDRFTVPSERTFRRVLAELDADALDLATCGYAIDVVRGQAPPPVIPRTPGPPEREERRAAQRAEEPPPPSTCCPARRSTARPCAAPAPPMAAGSSWSPRSPTSAASSWASAKSPTNAGSRA